ncbi:DUF4382 domain-containing protein [Natronomonas sp. EA1]|uniref:DUF4382 domain-containing protein n=1 Tax=Natronomonas sp. EA1 TaxID=3421655 RepID=UPI003EB891EE
MTRPLLAIALTAMLVLAGCSAPVSPGSNAPGGEGTIQFYVSDENNAIDDFEHLNVTITKVGLHQADANESDDAETETPNETEVENETETETEATEADDEDETGWVEQDVDNRAIDLTELKGANATMLTEFGVPNGTYDKAFVYVSDVEGTLKNGEQVEVKLPSSKMHINTAFTVGDGEEVQFVYDITVVKRGNSGKYNIKPVVSESGTDVPIEDVDDESDDAEDADEDEGTPEPSETPENDSEGAAANGQASMNFYVSDEKNAIDDFAHLNVTVTEIGVHGEDGWREYAVDNGTVDLTTLKGNNATLLSEVNISEGSYDKVFVYVSDVDGTLTNGETTDVKLPSSKLQINERFNVTAGEDVDFVYDITVVKRGNSGSYNIKPVVSESGTDVPIDKVDRDGEPVEDDEADEEAAGNLTASFVGTVTAGKNATVDVRYNGSAAENATVTYDGTDYTTDANGTVTVAVPEDAEEVEVTVTYQGAEVELAVEFGEEEPTPTADGSNDGTSEQGANTTETATPTPA